MVVGCVFYCHLIIGLRLCCLLNDSSFLQCLHTHICLSPFSAPAHAFTPPALDLTRYPILDTDLPHLRRDPMKTIRFVTQNLRLELTNDQASRHITDVLEVSRTMLVPGIMERIHKCAVAIKK